MTDDLQSGFDRLLAEGGSDVLKTTIREGHLGDEARVRAMTAASEYSDAGRERLERREYAAAVSAFWMSLSYELVLKSPFRLANDYGNLGMAYLMLGYLVESRAALDESLKLYTEANSAAGAAKTYYWLARCEVRKGNLANARRFANWSLKLFEKQQHPFTASASELFEWIDAHHREPESGAAATDFGNAPVNPL
jgi:tetratricopeptide (TPR) repeat protein